MIPTPHPSPARDPLAAKPGVPTYVIRLWRPEITKPYSSNLLDLQTHLFAAPDGTLVGWPGTARKFNTLPDAALFCVDHQESWKEQRCVSWEAMPVDMGALERQHAEWERRNTEYFANLHDPKPRAARALRFAFRLLSYLRREHSAKLSARNGKEPVNGQAVGVKVS